jgi:hypothetical protein
MVANEKLEQRRAAQADIAAVMATVECAVMTLPVDVAAHQLDGGPDPVLADMRHMAVGGAR